MHVAVCFWGLLRSLAHTELSIRDHCFAALTKAGYTYDVFVHSYRFEGAYSSERNHEAPTHLNFSEWRRLRPFYVHIEDQDAFDRGQNYSDYLTQGNPWENTSPHGEALRNEVRALHSLHHLALAVQAADAHARRNASLPHTARPYDAVIFLRPDVALLHPLPVRLLELFPQDTLFVPDFHRSCDGTEYNDRFAMGGLEPALTYGRRFSVARTYSQTRQLHAEEFLHAHLTARNVTVVEAPIRFRRIRAQGQTHQRDWDVISPLEQLAASPDGTLPHRTSWPLKLLYKSDHDDPANLYCAPHPKIDTVALAEYHHIRWHHRLPLNFSRRSDSHDHPHPPPRPPQLTDRTDGETSHRKVRKKRRRYANVEWVLELDPQQ